MRHWFGQSLTDWTMTAGDGGAVLFAGGVTITFWSAPVGGEQYLDLLDSSGNTVSSITSSDGTGSLPVGTIPRFQGPDNGATVLWADAGGPARYLIVATDLGDVVGQKLDLAGGTMAGAIILPDDSPAASQDYVQAQIEGAGLGSPMILPFSYDGIVSVRTGVERIYNDSPRTLTIGTVRASVGVAPDGQALIVDVNVNGTSIYTTQANRPTIAAGQLTGTGGTPDVATWAPGDYITVDVDQVGTTTPGSQLTVTIPAV